MPSAHSLAGLMKWVERDDWRDAFAQTLERHLAGSCAAFDLAIADLPDVIGNQWAMTLWGAAFEDFISRDLDGGRNAADDYLKRRGWKESPATREYIRALRHSVMSLYEVSDVVRDQGFLARDLVRSGEPVRVTERSATRSLRQWDRIATRVVTVRGQALISGVVFAFDGQTSDEALAAIARVAKKAPKEAAKLARQIGRPVADPTIAAAFSLDAVLAGSAFLFSTLWLRNALDKTLNPRLPTLVNSDGEPLELVTVHYALARSAKPAAVRAALAGISALRPEGSSFWNWLGPPPGNGAAATMPAGDGLSLTTTMDDGATVLGTLELAKGKLTLAVNSASRAERGRALIEPALGPLVGTPLVERQTVEQARASRPEAPARRPPGLSADAERQIVHRHLTEHYRRQLDTPILALGNQPPRRLVRTPSGRAKVAGWLKMLENHGAHETTGSMAGYDFTWLWDELGIADLRR